MTQMVWKTLRPEMKSVENSPSDFMVTLSMDSVDRDGDTIDPNGWNLDHYKRHPIVVSSHEYGDLRKQIGEIEPESLHVVKGALRGKVHYYVGEGNDEADWGAKLAAKNRAAYSVGFMPEEDEPRKGGGRHYLKQELLELSHVVVPSNRDALQLMAKSVKAGPVADIVNELLTEEPRRKDGPAQCAVSGCDDMSSAHVGICADHLKALTGLDPNPMRGYDPDYVAGLLMDGLALRRTVKAGRAISGANMDKLHSALGALHDVHDAACTDSGCPLGGGGGDGDDGGSASAHVSNHKAMGESSGSAGGVTVNEETGTHGAPSNDLTHSHPHDGNGVNEGDNGLHDHSHSHDAGEASHSHDHVDVNFKSVEKSHSELPDSAFACIDSGGTVEDGKTRPLSLRHYPHHTASGAVDDGLLRSALSRIADPSNEQCGKAHLEAHAKAEGIGQDDGKGTSFEDAVSKALEAAGW